MADIIINSIVFQVFLVSSAVYCIWWLLALLSHFIFTLMDEKLLHPILVFILTYVVNLFLFWLMMGK